MNTGAFGEGFPYTNFHDLNMDWIIKIAKDFLDQYTHIQEVIANGEQSLLDKTADGLEQLQEKADNLENLLQEWYNTHSQDIADQLADALQDLNSWYDTHITAINTALTNALTQFETDATVIANEVATSIPADYSALSQMVTNMSDYTLLIPDSVETGYFVNTDGSLVANADYSIFKYKVNPCMDYMISTRFGMMAIAYKCVYIVDDVVYTTKLGDTSGSTISKTINMTTPSLTMELWVSCQTAVLDAPTVYLTNDNGYMEMHHVANRMYTESGYIETPNYKTEWYAVEPNTTYIAILEYGLQAVGITFWASGRTDSLFVSANKFFPNCLVAFTTKSDTAFVTINCATPVPSNLEARNYVQGLKKLPTTKLSNMKWCVVGDSLTERNYRTSCNYYDYIKALIGSQYYQNIGVSGSGYAKYPAWKTAISGISDTDYDIITLFGSGNDVSSNLPLGTYTDTGEGTVAGYINDAITALISKKPTAIMGIITPPPWAQYCDGNLDGSMKNYVDLLIAIANYRGIPVLDLYRNSGLKPWLSTFRATYYTHDSDGVHPSEFGHIDFIVPQIYEFIKSIYPTTP